LIWQIHGLQQALSSNNISNAKNDDHVIAFCCTQCICLDEEKAKFYNQQSQTFMMNCTSIDKVLVNDNIQHIYDSAFE